MTNDTGMSPDDQIKALEEQLAAAKAQAKVRALQEELDALKAAEPSAAEPQPAAPEPEPEPAAAPEPIAEAAPAPAAPVAPVAPAAVAPPTAPAPTPTATGSGRGGGGLKALIAILIVLLLTTIAATFFAVRGDLRAPWAAPAAAPTELTLIPNGQFGPNPVVAAEQQNYLVYANLTTAASTTLPEPLSSIGITELAGSTPDLYGLGYGGCRTGDILDALEADQAVAAAWASAINADATAKFTVEGANVEPFWANLSVGVLLNDTRVTFNGYASGAVFPTQAVLQKGTIVMFDRYGFPRIHCLTGVPLTVPTTAGGETRFVGTAWEDFATDKIVRITPEEAPMASTTVVPVGPSNVTTSFTVSLGPCTGDPCDPPAATDTYFPTPADPTVLPTATECGNYASGLGDGDYVPVRLVNSTDSPKAGFTVRVPTDGCTVEYWATLMPGRGTLTGAWPGALFVFTDGQTAAQTGEFVGGTEPTLWVLQ